MVTQEALAPRMLMSQRNHYWHLSRFAGIGGRGDETLARQMCGEAAEVKSTRPLTFNIGRWDPPDQSYRLLMSSRSRWGEGDALWATLVNFSPTSSAGQMSSDYFRVQKGAFSIRAVVFKMLQGWNTFGSFSEEKVKICPLSTFKYKKERKTWRDRHYNWFTDE